MCYCARHPTRRHPYSAHVIRTPTILRQGSGAEHARSSRSAQVRNTKCCRQGTPRGKEDSEKEMRKAFMGSLVCSYLKLHRQLMGLERVHETNDPARIYSRCGQSLKSAFTEDSILTLTCPSYKHATPLQFRHASFFYSCS